MFEFDRCSIKWCSTHHYMKSVHRPKSFKCENCDRMYTTKINLNRHLKTVHWKDSTSFKCKICSEELKSTHYLKVHVRTYHEFKSKDHICEICNKSFYTKTEVARHNIVSHSPQVQCDKCLKFLNQSSLKNHLKDVHSKNDPYPCMQCGSQLKSRLQLKRHVKYVHNPKSFRCNECDKMFAKKCGLKTHVKDIHLRVTYQCKICPEELASYYLRKLHMKKIHNDEQNQSKPIC